MSMYVFFLLILCRDECPAENGLVVDTGASNVTMVGLAIEHATEDQLIWNGDNGKRIRVLIVRFRHGHL